MVNSGPMLFLVAFIQGLILIANGQTCNLLTSDNSEYVDYSSFAQIDELCSQDYNTLSSWEKFQCDARNGRNETCWPRRYFSNCAPGKLRGIAFFYHGYSACPDQYQDQRNT